MAGGNSVDREWLQGRFDEHSSQLAEQGKVVAVIADRTERIEGEMSLCRAEIANNARGLHAQGCRIDTIEKREQQRSEELHAVKEVTGEIKIREIEEMAANRAIEKQRKRVRLLLGTVIGLLSATVPLLIWLLGGKS
ncbi:MAG: hypothetical protein GY835_23875 [bacterium]|nr:hypothetical protein [bacterium]